MHYSIKFPDGECVESIKIEDIKEFEEVKKIVRSLITSAPTNGGCFSFKDSSGNEIFLSKQMLEKSIITFSQCG